VSAFNSFEEAHNSMNVYLHEFILFLASLDPDLPRDLPRLQAMAWDGKIDMFRKLVNFAEIVVEK